MPSIHSLTTLTSPAARHARAPRGGGGGGAGPGPGHCGREQRRGGSAAGAGAFRSAAGSRGERRRGAAACPGPEPRRGAARLRRALPLGARSPPVPGGHCPARAGAARAASPPRCAETRRGPRPAPPGPPSSKVPSRARHPHTTPAPAPAPAPLFVPGGQVHALNILRHVFLDTSLAKEVTPRPAQPAPPPFPRPFSPLGPLARGPPLLRVQSRPCFAELPTLAPAPHPATREPHHHHPRPRPAASNPPRSSPLLPAPCSPSSRPRMSRAQPPHHHHLLQRLPPPHIQPVRQPRRSPAAMQARARAPHPAALARPARSPALDPALPAVLRGRRPCTSVLRVSESGPCAASLAATRVETGGRQVRS